MHTIQNDANVFSVFCFRAPDFGIGFNNTLGLLLSDARSTDRLHLQLKDGLQTYNLITTCAPS